MLYVKLCYLDVFINCDREHIWAMRQFETKKKKRTFSTIALVTDINCLVPWNCNFLFSFITVAIEMMSTAVMVDLGLEMPMRREGVMAMAPAPPVDLVVDHQVEQEVQHQVR